MKKISLFVATLMMSLLMSISANAQRAWAYDLALAVEGEQYTFSYKAVTAGTATLIFTDVTGVELATVDLGTVEAGANTKVLTASELPAGQEVNWSVKMSGDAIATLTEVTDASKGIYNFYLPQDVTVDNNPESNYFGTIYVAEGTDGYNDGASDRTKTQKRGVFVYNQALEELNPTNVGYLPANAAPLMTDASRQSLHRMAVNPVNNNVAYCYNVEGASAIWSMDPANLSGDAVNLIEGLTITKANALCFDEEGALYVLDNANTTAGGGTIVKVVNGVLDTIAQDAIWGVQDMSLVSDGRGGLWLAQHRWAVDDYAVLSHVNAAGEVDYKVVTGSDEAGLFPNDANASYRGQCAYYVAEDVLAFGGNKVVTLFQVSYDEATGVPSLAKIQSTPAMGNNIDGVAFDYAGDLYVVCASSERFYKYTVPTENNVCTTPAAAKYAFELEGEEPEVEYQVYEDEITNLIFDLESDPLVCYGGPSTNFAIDVYLILGEEDGNGKFTLTEESAVAVLGSDATFIEGYLENIDVYAPKADAVIRCEWNGMKLELHLSMSSAPIEATVVVVENAIIEVEKYLLFGDTYDYALKMTGVWTDAEGLEYPVLVEVPVYYPEATEPTTIRSTVTVGGWGDDENWLGFGEGDLTVTTVGSTITATGVVNNPGTGVSIDITISGSIVPSGVENATIMINSIKTIKNGQLIIEQDGVKYNAQGAILK